MEKISWALCNEEYPSIYWVDHSIQLWLNWGHNFHSFCTSESFWDVSEYKRIIVHIYVLIQMWLELYSHYEIEKIDMSIETELYEYRRKLASLYSNSKLLRNKKRIVNTNSYNMKQKYNNGTIINVSNVEMNLIKKLKHEIESSHSLSFMHTYILNLRTADFLENTTIKTSQFMYVINSISDRNNKNCYMWIDAAKNIKNEIVKYWNRDIVNELNEHKQIIIELQKQNIIAKNIISAGFDIEHRYDMEELMKNKNEEIENILKVKSKEMDEIKALHKTIIDEITKENEELKHKIFVLLKEKEEKDKHSKCITIQDDLLTSKSKINLNLASSITIDVSKLDKHIDYQNYSELLKFEEFSIKNLNIHQKVEIEKFNLFLENFSIQKWKIFNIEAWLESSIEIYSFIETLTFIFPYISDQILIKGFNIDSTSFKQLIESIHNVKNLSLFDWTINIHSLITFDFPSVHNLKEITFSNTQVNLGEEDNSLNQKAKILVNSFKEASFYKDLEKFTFLNVSEFDEEWMKEIQI